MDGAAAEDLALEFADAIDLEEGHVPVDLGEVGGPSVSCFSDMLLVVLRELGGSSVSCLSGVLLVVLRRNPEITGLIVAFGGDLEDLNHGPDVGVFFPAPPRLRGIVVIHKP